MVDPKNNYTIMQHTKYSGMATHWSHENRDVVVGSFDAHNLHPDYDNLFEGFDTKSMTALDFGCGPGRCLVLYQDRFAQMDGADIAIENLGAAKTWLSLNNGTIHELYHINGIELNGVPDTKYDLVYSTICLQHICVHEIRFSILQDMYRVLKPGGWITIQMGFGINKRDSVGYFDNFYDADNTNGSMDTRIESPNELLVDLTEIGYTHFSYKICGVGPGDNHTNWIFFRAQKPLDKMT
jgi:SAM-dependent methyltransferase